MINCQGRVKKRLFYREGYLRAEDRPFKAPFNSKSKVLGRNDMGDGGEGRSWSDEMPIYPE